MTGIGHFFNSIHLWSVELFFFFMVIHLWGKYWMAAWRGGRARIWMTGAVTFLVAIPCALTGYVSQQNFDSQWISTQAKDAMNSVGIGSFFNLLNFGQMYSYHILLLPAGRRRARHRARAAGPQPRRRAAVRARQRRQRARGSATPATVAPTARRALSSAALARSAARPENEAAREWHGGYRRYDLVKEVTIAIGVVLGLAVVLTVLFSSPDEPPSTIKQWSRTDPVDFVTTAVSELDGTSETADLRAALQPQRRRAAHSVHPPAEVARRQPSDQRRRDFVLDPLRSIPGAARRCRARWRSLQRCVGQAAGRVDDRLLECAGEGKATSGPATGRRAAPATTARCRR